MWELNYKESWAPKNWCFWTVVLEKTLGSPLDSKEIQPVSSKGNQSWIIIGMTEAPILWHSAFFIVQRSHPYMTTGKITALTISTLVGKVMPLLFNRMSMFVIAFLSRSKHLNFMAAVTAHSDFGGQENEVFHCLHFFPTYLPWSDGNKCQILHFLNVKF